MADGRTTRVRKAHMRTMRKRMTRRKQYRKQRGGEGNEENRWSTPMTKIPVEVTPMNKNDKRLLQQVLRGMNSSV